MDCRWHCGRIFLTALKVNVDSALCDVTPVHNVQRHVEELEQRILALEQESCGPEEPSISDSEAVSDDDDEHYETKGPCLAARSIVQQKVEHEQRWPGGTSSRDPHTTEFMTYRPYTQAVG
ncbi:hypothetical protein JEQ12_007050 [Ovis aries]|uniref:Uncharacterized protein n=1 Tax=Ovis aries TaxID=9940 RepID=A0A835ZYT5_SHEEP|nr:hypothetical protein JEQ12_007050 [Ovis aries]